MAALAPTTAPPARTLPLLWMLPCAFRAARSAKEPARPASRTSPGSAFLARQPARLAPTPRIAPIAALAWGLTACAASAPRPTARAWLLTVTTAAQPWTPQESALTPARPRAAHAQEVTAPPAAQDSSSSHERSARMVSAWPESASSASRMRTAVVHRRATSARTSASAPRMANAARTTPVQIAARSSLPADSAWLPPRNAPRTKIAPPISNARKASAKTSR